MRLWITLAAALLLTLTADSLPAQITTVVVPPRPERPEADPVAERVRRAERLEERIGEMRVWVDSVAVAVEAAPTIRDTVPVERDTASALPRERLPRAELPPPREPQRTTVFREGAPAPATATPMPLLAMVGAAAAAAGLLLRRRRG